LNRGPAKHGAEQQKDVTDSRQNPERTGDTERSLSAAGRVHEDRALPVATLSVHIHRSHENTALHDADPTASVRAAFICDRVAFDQRQLTADQRGPLAIEGLAKVRR